MTRATKSTTPTGIEFLGAASLPGNASDRSGLPGDMAAGIPANRVGGLGSAIAWTGVGKRYVALSDRGPRDGAVRYLCRFHDLDIAVDPTGRPRLSAALVSTTLLTNEAGENLVGLSSAFDTRDPAAALRFDPEAIRLGPESTLFLADDYGPFVAEFTRAGARLRLLPVPAAFAVAHPHAAKDHETTGNTSGRVTNHGFEGLAISPDGGRLHALMQGALIQDGGAAAVNCRLLEIDRRTGATRQFVVPLATPALGFHEILAVTGSTFLAIERDGHAGARARVKSIVSLDLTGATDVSGVAALPPAGVPAGVVAVMKRPFIDLLDPRFGLAGAGFPEKIEGLAFGPDLADGRHLLIVTTDNDFKADQSTWVWAFGIAPAMLPGFRPPHAGGAPARALPEPRRRPPAAARPPRMQSRGPG